MKKLYNLLLLMSVSLCLSAQYSTPGTGVNWTMDDLVANSGGAVISTEPSVFEIMTELIISASDTLLFTATTIVSVHQDILITVEGTLLTQIPDLDQITFTTYEIDQYFQGFRFDNSPGSLLKNFIISTAGGIKLVESDVIFLNCHFSAFNQGQCTGTIDLYQSRPVIDNCEFLDNAGPAVLSGANSASSPQIINCNIFRNTNSNTNMPQINLGTSGVDSIRIINCQIIGDPELIRVGGIAITTLAGGILEARIENNVIQDNRYGITAYGFDIGSVIRYNQILDNNTQNLPMQGGSGINFWGGASNHSILTGNTITGNLWGITIQANAQPNLGDISGEPSNPGMNQIYDNGNGGEVYDLYNDTPDPIMAQNNWWGTMDPDIVEMHIYHQVDDPSLGLVDFMPLFNPFTGMYENDVLENVALIECIYPNPAKSRFYIHLNHEMIPVGENVNLLISNINGQLLYKMDYEYEGRDIKVNLPDIDCELLTIRISANGFSDIKKTISLR